MSGPRLLRPRSIPVAPFQLTLDGLLDRHPDARRIGFTRTGRPFAVLQGGGIPEPRARAGRAEARGMSGDPDGTTRGAACCAIGCVVAMAGVTGFLLLVAWAFAPWIGEALA